MLARVYSSLQILLAGLGRRGAVREFTTQRKCPPYSSSSFLTAARRQVEEEFIARLLALPRGGVHLTPMVTAADAPVGGWLAVSASGVCVLLPDVTAPPRRRWSWMDLRRMQTRGKHVTISFVNKRSPDFSFSAAEHGDVEVRLYSY